MFRILTLNEAKEWSSIVNSFEPVDIYYTPGYVKPFYENGDGEPFLSYYEDIKGRVINVFLLRDIAEDERFQNLMGKNKYYDIITPYGYGGPLYESYGDIKELSNNYFKAFSEFCIENNIVSEFIRLHPLLKNHTFSQYFYDIKKIRKTVYIDLRGGEDAILNNMITASKKSVRKAERYGVRIIHGKDKYLIDEFKRLYYETMDKNNAEKYYYFKNDFFNFTLEQENSMIFAALYEDKIIAARIELFSKKFMHDHLAGADMKYLNLAPNNLLIYEIAKWGSKEGMMFLHMGGGYKSAEDSLYRFKKSFTNNEPLDFYIAKKIHNYDNYNILVEKRKKMDEKYNSLSEFFPAYRA